MLTNAFIGKPDPPGAEELAAELGPAARLWERLIASLKRGHSVDNQDWHSYSRKAGWTLRLKKQERTILYLSPSHGAFMASFALGDRAVKAARESDLAHDVIELIASSRRYAEGTAVRIDVKQQKDLAAVTKLAAIKLEH